MMEACLKKEENRNEVETVAEHQDVSNEDAAMETVQALEGRCHWPEKWTEGSSGYWQKFIPTLHKGPGKVIVARGALKDERYRTVAAAEMQQWNKGPRCKTADTSEGEKIWQDLQKDWRSQSE